MRALENIIKSIESFEPDFNLDAPLWASNPHVQTVTRAFLKSTPSVHYNRERLDTPDEDFVDIDRIEGNPEKPFLIAFHGLEGSSRSPYAVMTMERARELDWEGFVFNFRGCSGETNRTIGSYHSGITTELDWLLERFEKQLKKRQVFLVGFSLGGNVLTRWLGERGKDIPKFVKGTAAVGSPYNLLESARILDRGINLGYVWWFLRTLKKKAEDKNKRFPGIIDIERVRKARTLHEFDSAVIAPIYGFKDAVDYYKKVRSIDVLQDIQIPTLLFNAKDDPFFSSEFLPTQASLKGSTVQTFFPRHGGHLGFVSRTKHHYMEDQIFAWFKSLL